MCVLCVCCCCWRTSFDYGNAENITKDGKANVMDDGSMEAIYFGRAYGPNGPGSGKGPWIGADMENGIYEGQSQHASAPSRNKTNFIVGFVKGDSGNHYNIKTGDPEQAGSLETVYDGAPRGPLHARALHG